MRISSIEISNRLFSRNGKKITFAMLESEKIYGRHRIQYKIDHTVSAVAMSQPLSAAGG